MRRVHLPPPSDSPFFEDGAEPAQFAGYRAIGEEILEQAPRPPAAVIVPVGNGALLVASARPSARRRRRSSAWASWPPPRP